MTFIDKSFNIGTFKSEDYFNLIEDITISTLTPKINTVSLPERDGVINFSSDNMWKRNVYEQRIITIVGVVKWNVWNEIQGHPDADRMLYISSIYNAIYKNAVGELEVSTTPGVIWEATLENIQNIETTGFTTFRVAIQYKCQPFSKEKDYLGIDKTLSLSNPVTFDLNSDKWAPTNSFSLEVISSDEMLGTATVSIINTSTNEFLEISDIDLTGTNKLNVDFENFNIDYKTRLYKNKSWTGDFFEIKPGNNIAINHNIQNGQATLRYRPKYFYGKTYY